MRFYIKLAQSESCQKIGVTIEASLTHFGQNLKSHEIEVFQVSTHSERHRIRYPLFDKACAFIKLSLRLISYQIILFV